MRTVKNILKCFFCFLLIPTTYILVSFILTLITIDRKDGILNSDTSIFLSTNGVHLDIVIPKENLTGSILFK